MSLQPFKINDDVEAKLTEAFVSSLRVVDGQFDAMFAGVYTAQPMGGAIYDAGADPLVGPLVRASYIVSFLQIHALFQRPGTYELYLAVFRAIWGSDVSVVFTPTPGKLSIVIEALSTTLELFAARRIEDNHYMDDEVLAENLDNLVFQVPTGIKTQQEVDALMRELHPIGIWVEATLDIT